MRYCRFLIITLFFSACQKDSNNITVFSGNGPADWLVPKNEVIDGGVGIDGIPSVDNPQFSRPEDLGNYYNQDLVLGFIHEGEIKAYPHPILDWHEIINDEINGLPIAITYCPLTGTGIGWSRDLGGFTTTFGVSGLLYNNNLMPYDRRTKSTWSQQKNECVNGNLISRKPSTYTLIETSFSTWKKSFPETKVMNGNTGFDRAYAFYPYNDYKTNHDLLFYPLSPKDERLPAKERVLGVIINEAAKVYSFNCLGEGTELIADNLGNENIIIVRSKRENFIIPFLNPENLKFEVIPNGLPQLMQDNKGNIYNLAGVIMEGSEVDKRLEQPMAFMGYWFSWGAFYPNIDIY